MIFEGTTVDIFATVSVWSEHRCLATKSADWNRETVKPVVKVLKCSFILLRVNYGKCVGVRVAIERFCDH